MTAIAENLQTIKNSTLLIKQAIIDKGGTIDGDITTWANVISGLSGGEIQPTANIIQNKLNGGTIGDPTVLYSTDTVLYTYNVSNCTDYIIIHNPTQGYGYNRISHSNTISNNYYFSYEGGIIHGIYFTAQDGFSSSAVDNNIELCSYHIASSLGMTYEQSFYIIAFSDEKFDFDYFTLNISEASCYVKDTKISLYNGITKKVQDINYNDEILVWNFDEGKFDKAKPLWIKKEEKTNNYYKVTLDNGNTINLVGSNGKCHRLFNYDDMIFESATELVGKNVHTLNGINKVVSVDNIKETVEYYNIITNYHMNCFANGILTSCRFNNLYPIKDMVFDKSNVNVEPRWKIHQEKFKPNPEILPEYIRGMRLDENQTISIEEMKKYITNLEIRKKTVMDFEENIEYCSNIEDTEVGWISPEGEVFGYKLYMQGQRTHEIIAKNICNKKNIDSDNYSKTLEQLGFVKYTNTFIACGENVDITERQEKHIKKFMNDNKKIKERGTIKINNYIGKDVKVQELYSFDIKSLSQKLRGKHGNKKN